MGTEYADTLQWIRVFCALGKGGSGFCHLAGALFLGDRCVVARGE